MWLPGGLDTSPGSSMLVAERKRREADGGRDTAKHYDGFARSEASAKRRVRSSTSSTFVNGKTQSSIVR
jgi:hypothetical protein